MTALRSHLARAALVAAFLAATPASAISILVTVDTSALAGTQADLAFDLVDGGPPANLVTITKFATDGALGAAATKGNVTGTLPGSVTLADTVLLSEYRHAATLGKSLSFVINATGKAPGAASFPTASRSSCSITRPASPSSRRATRAARTPCCC